MIRVAEITGCADCGQYDCKRSHGGRSSDCAFNYICKKDGHKVNANDSMELFKNCPLPTKE